jgi:hypothetical protein
MKKGNKADYSRQSGAEPKNLQRYTSIPPYDFMAWCLITHGEFTFT